MKDAAEKWKGIPYPESRKAKFCYEIIGLLLLTLGFSWILLADLGADPAGMVAQGLSAKLNISRGKKL